MALSRRGETAIANKKRRISNIYLNPPDVQGTPDAIKAISEAQAIILGPGSLYTSVIPNLLIKEIREAILASSALKIYISNVMTQPGKLTAIALMNTSRQLPNTVRLR